MGANAEADAQRAATKRTCFIMVLWGSDRCSGTNVAVVEVDFDKRDVLLLVGNEICLQGGFCARTSSRRVLSCRVLYLCKESGISAEQQLRNQRTSVWYRNYRKLNCIHVPVDR